MHPPDRHLQPDGEMRGYAVFRKAYLQQIESLNLNGKTAFRNRPSRRN